MTTVDPLGGKVSIRSMVLALVLALFGLVNPALAADTNAADASSPEADKAWKEFEKARQPPLPPAEWQTSPPSVEQREKFRGLQAGLAGLAADKAREFYTTYPDHPKATNARAAEQQLLQIAVRLGNTNKLAELEARERARITDPAVPEDERVQLGLQAAQRAAMAKRSEGQDAVMAELEKGLRELLKQFPKRVEVYQMLLAVADDFGPEKARAIAKEVAAATDSEPLKEQAQGLLRKLDLIGNSLDVKFTAVDGREVDLAGMTGKVVLVDFWATWCGPCVAELPNVKRTYDRLHAKGFEIVGISFDRDKEKLESFVAREKMAWPQYFDGKGWQNKVGQEYGIRSIPTMWLVDKQGKVRDMNARADLETKVEKLLAE